MDKRIAILGSGMIGGQTARLSVAAGYNTVIANTRGPETLQELVNELGPLAHAATAEEAIQAADLIVAAIPFAAYTHLSPELLAGKTVIDTMNYYPECDGEMAEIETDVISTSELVQRHLARSHVVRAINNVDWVRLLTNARPTGAADRSALPVAGDDADAKRSTISFVEAIGYDVVDMGPLSESWRSEPTMPAYVMPYIGNIPADLTQATERGWFLANPGNVVSRDDLKALLAKAVRHDRMFGSLAGLAGSRL
ncbi:NAD(P)-binding domain-containing protein [Agrobacterium sp. Ap1]|uniref:NADPH-dependent F420 reductase n=1 Tax=Agrobacterium sp. Ap1 TaxID=2815337 RepID=UPI001A8D39CB|nr:NAD(P)-binding domain-containing protein [Agrobacterium sp. Ap1]MBO0144638.1 NAD(P)-binding domain-containing protein [Agrobacterium sp. Ap1]